MLTKLDEIWALQLVETCFCFALFYFPDDLSSYYSKMSPPQM